MILSLSLASLTHSQTRSFSMFSMTLSPTVTGIILRVPSPYLVLRYSNAYLAVSFSNSGNSVYSFGGGSMMSMGGGGGSMMMMGGMVMLQVSCLHSHQLHLLG